MKWQEEQCKSSILPWGQPRASLDESYTTLLSTGQASLVKIGSGLIEVAQMEQNGFITRLFLKIHPGCK